ncbi:Glyoxalase/Bleomycin resistance protein/Dihydroxybiphenyl dioxygenase [Leptodontidium sp. 2 PMI_412]|nr:Glyoxalase/Bleomycin resistance protein/Dihydroxybiphenyl dioxygenase [Leptodontidium sp. 2 PMI_412]
MPHLAHISLLVRSYDEAIAFYTRLGFTVVEDTFIPSQSKRWVTIRPPHTPSLFTSASQLSGGRVFLFLATDDFDRNYKRFSEAGVEWIREPKVEKYGKVVV